MGTDLIEFYRRKIKREWMLAFLSTLVIGLLIHLYKLTNTLPNHDTLYNYYSDQNVIGSGRWLLSLACGISSYFDLPWVNGIISLAWIACTAVILVEVLELRNPFLICLSAGLLVASPAITETFFFGFTADGYMLAMFLSTLSVWLTRAETLSVRRSCLATVCICCTCAIYQAYVSFALVLALCYFILKLLDDALSARQMRKWIVTQIMVYGIGLAGYYVIWQVLMRLGGYVANNYQGISTLSLNLQTVLRGFPNTIRVILLFFLEWNPMEHGWTLYGALNLIFLGLMAIGMIYAIIKTRIYSHVPRLVLFLMSAIAIPFGACIWVFCSEDVNYRPMMLASMCLVYILVAVIYEKYFSKIGKNLLALLLVGIVFNQGLMANIAYAYMNRSYLSTYADATEMLAEIHDLDTDSKQIAVVGNKTREVSLDDVPHAKKIHMLGQLLETNLMYDEEHLVYFLNETFYADFIRADKKWESDAGIGKQIAEMSIWPEKDSIRVIDDVIFIKLKEIE